MRGNTDAYVAARLLTNSETNPRTGCVEWRGVTMKGYGRIRFRRKWTAVHRAALVLTGRDVSPDAHVLHMCDNRACINPDHLFLGSNADNIEDKARKGRAGKKLTLDDAREIHRRLAAGDRQSRIAADYGINPSSVSDINRGATWSLALGEKL